MNNYLMISAFFISVALTSLATLAGTSEIEWSNPEKYRDVKAGNESRVKYQERIFADFEEHFMKMAAALPEGHKLKINVTDVDLAGDVNAGGIDRIRIINDLYFPRLKFNYVLLDEAGNKVKAGGINLKDMAFLMNSSLRYRNQSLGYEKKMLDKWFNRTFDSMVASVDS